MQRYTAAWGGRWGEEGGQTIEDDGGSELRSLVKVDDGTVQEESGEGWRSPTGGLEPDVIVADGRSHT
jgi:hypothetical protein